MLPLKADFTMLVLGSSRTGKTTLVRKMIKSNVCEKKIKKVIWCYNYASPWFIEEPDFRFVQGLPDDFENGQLIVIDDFMHSLNGKIAQLFTVSSHHCGVSVILILQNIFPRSPVMRDISLNAQYIILFKNSRDMNQVNTLCRQIYPQNSKFMLDAFIKATSEPYNYLFINLHPLTTPAFRLSASLFPDVNGLHWFYAPK